MISNDRIIFRWQLMGQILVAAMMAPIMDETQRHTRCLNADDQEAINYLGGRADRSLEEQIPTRHVLATKHPFRIRCHTCEQVKPYYEFSPSFRGPRPASKRHCRSCVRLLAQKYRPPERQRAYCAANKERIREYHRNYKKRIAYLKQKVERA